MSITRANAVRARGRTIELGELRLVVRCDDPDCEWFTAAPANHDAAVEAELAHARVVHPGDHAAKVWEHHGRPLRRVVKLLDASAAGG